MYVKNEYILFSILHQVHFVEKNNRAVCVPVFKDAHSLVFTYIYAPLVFIYTPLFNDICQGENKT